MDNELKQYIDESKKTMVLLKSFFGDNSMPVTNVWMKWPDAVDSLMNNDIKQFKKDLSDIICIPVMVITDALIERLKSLDSKIDVYGYRAQLANTSKIVNPIEAKKDMIRICNVVIYQLKKYGVEVELL